MPLLAALFGGRLTARTCLLVFRNRSVATQDPGSFAFKGLHVPQGCAAKKGRLVPSVWGYARVSREDQNLALQLDALEAAGVTQANMVEEKESGARQRPGVNAG